MRKKEREREMEIERDREMCFQKENPPSEEPFRESEREKVT